MVVGVLTLSSRSVIGRLETNVFVVRTMIGFLHGVRDIDPEDPSNMDVLLAFELTHVDPQSFRLNDVASENM